ncbi:hypothetical protein M1349_01130 [Patescibacteria group bacterium]|nr:hypothetical protein [Patescibacteria group bacterium]
MDYCYSKYSDKYHYQISSCFEKERNNWQFLLMMDEKTPKVAITIIGINIIGFGIYRYLFPKRTIIKNKNEADK